MAPRRTSSKSRDSFRLTPFLKNILFGLRPDQKPQERQKGFAALCVCGPTGVVPKRMGDNYGCRPIAFSVSQSWVDQISRKLDSASPTFSQKVLFRVWCEKSIYANTLQGLVLRAIPSDLLKGNYWDFGPELDLRRLENAIRTIALDNGMRTWNDREMVAHLQSIADEIERKKKDARAQLKTDAQRDASAWNRQYRKAV